jgi:hypothetical protein
MNPTHAAAAVLFAGAAALGLAAPALADTAPSGPLADPTALGTFTFEGEDGETAQWTVTPCAEDSVHCVRVASSGNAERAPWSSNAYWTVGSWILFVEQPDAVRCADGTTAPGNNNYSWDGGSLNGYASINTSACGEAESIAIPFTLTKTGEPPRMPDAPVQVEPYIVDIPPPYVPPQQGAAEAPAPVEQDPAIVASPNPIPNESDPLTEAIVAEPGFNAIPGGGEGARR